MKKRGIITAIHGPMFSGKTEELLRRIRRAKIAKKKCQLFKPEKDIRYHKTKIVPHYLAGEKAADLGEDAITVSSTQDLREKINSETQVIGIEEAQFFETDLIKLVRDLSEEGKNVILSMLDQDFRREPFPLPAKEGECPRNVGEYLAIAHESVKLTAICVVCGNPAQHSQKLALTGTYKNGKPIYVPASYHDDVVLVGTNLENSPDFPPFIYEARCKDCHIIPDYP